MLSRQQRIRCRTLRLASCAVIAACTTEPTAPVSVAGAWSSVASGMGAPPEEYDFELTESSDSVSGTGSWGPASFEIRGRYVKPGISLIFVEHLAQLSQLDTMLRFEGTVRGRVMVGVAGDGLKFYKQ